MPDFFGQDQFHSRTKRVLLRNILGAVFPSFWSLRLNLDLPGSDACLTYLDAFAGKGRYGKDSEERTLEQAEEQTLKQVEEQTLEQVEEQTLEQDISQWGSPIIAVEKALTCLNQYTVDQILKIFFNTEYAVKFVFNDKNKNHINTLKGLVKERFKLHDWDVEQEDENRQWTVFSGTPKPRKYSDLQEPCLPAIDIPTLKMRVEWFCKEFEDLDLESLPSPLFSFIDPCGIKQIPMESMRHLIGKNREVFINLMVATVNRNLSKRGTAIEDLYGLFRHYKLEEDAGRLEGREKLEYLATTYCNALKKEFMERHEEECPDGFFPCKFAVRKAKKDPYIGTIYYMVFGTCNLTFLHNAKKAMMKVTDEAEELSFSSFYPLNGVHIPYERKTSDELEAAWVFQHFKGQTVTLGEIKEWILLETPFPYHAKCLKYLEDHFKIIHVQQPYLVLLEENQRMHVILEREKKRNHGVFCAHISISKNQGNGRKIYGNFWKVSFCDEEMATQFETFIPISTEPNIKLLGDWICKKLTKIDAGYISRDDLRRYMPKEVPSSLLTTAIDELEKRGRVSCRPRSPQREMKIYLVRNKRQTTISEMFAAKKKRNPFQGTDTK